MTSKYTRFFQPLTNLYKAALKNDYGIRPMSTTRCMYDETVEEQGERDKKNKMVAFDAYFGQDRTKTKETFIEIIDNFKNRRFRTGEVEFIHVCLKRLKQYGLDDDLEMYKRILNILPKGKMVPENVFQSEFMFFPRHQDCIVDMLMIMEENGVMPDRELEDMLVAIFGNRAVPVKRYYRMMYWLPKFRFASPWLLPKPVPKDPQKLAEMAISRMGTVDLRTNIQVFKTSELEDCAEDTWVVNGQSPKQMELLKYHPENWPIYLEGGFKIYLRKSCITYFVLRADIPPNRRRRPFKDPDVVKNLKIPFFDPPDAIDQIPKFSVHEQKDGIIYAIGATGTSSKESLLAWLHLLEKHGNPNLGKIPIIFRTNSPLGRSTPIEGIESGQDIKLITTT